jgi:hypothetical protein
MSRSVSRMRKGGATTGAFTSAAASVPVCELFIEDGSAPATSSP